MLRKASIPRLGIRRDSRDTALGDGGVSLYRDNALGGDRSMRTARWIGPDMSSTHGCQ